MTNKKVLIFENQVSKVENTFNAINLFEFDNLLEYTYCESYQKLGGLKNIKDYDLIIIDIELARNSSKDGYGILNEIQNTYPEILKKVFILSGSTYVKTKLKEQNLPDIIIHNKPTNMDEIAKTMLEILT